MSSALSKWTWYLTDSELFLRPAATATPATEQPEAGWKQKSCTFLHCRCCSPWNECSMIYLKNGGLNQYWIVCWMFAANAERNLFASSGSAITTDFSDMFSVTSLYRKSVRHLQSLQLLRPASMGLRFLEVAVGCWNWLQHKTFLHSWNLLNHLSFRNHHFDFAFKRFDFSLNNYPCAGILCRQAYEACHRHATHRDRAVIAIQITAPALRKGPGKGPAKGPAKGPPAPAAETAEQAPEFLWHLVTIVS